MIVNLLKIFSKNSDQRVRLAEAIEQDQIWPAFQPIVSLQSGVVVGFEVLARWDDPISGSVSPDIFIPLLKQNGLIELFTMRQIENACGQAAAWGDDIFLAFNVAPEQLQEPGLATRIAKTVETTGFPIERIQIEVTESSLISDTDRAYATLGKLIDYGMTVSIDDFGTGYSSLSRLVSFPFRKVKIDRSFVSGLDRSKEKLRIVAGVIGLAQSLGMAVIAEGVETKEEAEVLKSFGCEYAQGWLYGKAQAFREVAGRICHRSAVEGPRKISDVSPFVQYHQLNSLYEQAPVGLCFTDLDFRHVRTNERFAAIHGLRSHEIQNKTPAEITTPEIARKIEAELNSMLKGEVHTPQIYVVNGVPHLVFASLVRDVVGDPIGFSVMSVDVETVRSVMTTDAATILQSSQVSKKWLRGNRR